MEGEAEKDGVRATGPGACASNPREESDVDGVNGAADVRAAGLGAFSPAVRAWFLDAFAAPTPVQERAWEAIEAGENVLVVAPTGSGKTLAAFLFAIDGLMQKKATKDGRPRAKGEDATGLAKDGTAGPDVADAALATARPAKGVRLAKGESPDAVRPREKGVRVLYVSPLKALGADVERNLQEPLAGIAARLAATGGDAPQVRTGMRTGDTTPEQRRALQRNPPDILITTPESLYLMLTSKARDILRTVDVVIVDEVHALAGNKRGAHLALSLERLDVLLERPAQRIGLSATVRPREEVARFLGGMHPVQVVADEGRPDLDVRVVVPVRDMTAIPAYGGADVAGGLPAHGDGLAGGVSAPAARRGGGSAGPRRAPQEEAWKSDRALRRLMAGERPAAAAAGTPDSRAGSSSIWPLIEAAVLDQVLAHRSTIVFVNSRGLCERLTARLNELYAKRRGLVPGSTAAGALSADDGEEGGAHGRDVPFLGMRSDMGSTSALVQLPDASEVIAKAHHGSVSKERRLQVERELKSGQLPCVVATSSLELGIDMGAVDLALQVAPPPSVASGLQRIGRANHQVGGRSEGIIYPRTRTEVVDGAVVAEGMHEGAIEPTALVKNALDVLAQQTVAAVAMDDWAVEDWFETVRRAAPYADLPRSAFRAVLDMLAGRYASADLSDFKPRIVWDRETGRLSARPGAQRLAVVAAGTIPDRGMFSVVLPEGDAAAGRRRVGELDEEMVYESRVGDIIALGTSTWRIREITRDRVIVEPAPGRSARLPFWHGEGVGRPAETGCARGAFLRAVAAGIVDDASDGEGVCVDDALCERLAADGLDDDAQRNLVALVREQRAATGVVPDDRTLVVERCEDETGDWRVMLHSPYGRRVHEPWAMAVADRTMRLYGYDPQVLAADDGIVLRIPQTETRLPGAELFVFDPDELDRIVRDRVDATSLFAARFRECAARALLMSPTTPGKRAPLWQQRLKAGQLLEAARREQEFPILLETARECLQDVYDLPALHELMERMQAGSVRLVEAQTSVPSPFAASLLFGYVGDHLYDGDLPHAERRASLLSLDPALLGELLGSADMAELLDAEVTHTVQAQLQRLAPDRRVRGVEGVADLLRALGPLSAEEVAARMQATEGTEAAAGEGRLEEDCGEAAADTAAQGREAVVEGADAVSHDGAADPASLQEAEAALAVLCDSHRAFPARIGGKERWAAADDAALLHEALGVEVPAWAQSDVGGAAEMVLADRPGAADGWGWSGGPDEFDAGRPADQERCRTHPLDALVARYARTRGPFSTNEAATRWGIGPAIVRESLERLADEGRIVRGRFGGGATSDAGAKAPEREWVAAEVFRRLRSRSLAKARAAVQAVPGSAFVRLVLDLQDVAGATGAAALEGTDGVAQVIAQFEGVFLPAAAWEGQVLPARVRDFRPGMLDELIASGDVLWVGSGHGAGEQEGGAGRSASRAAAKAAPPAGLVAFFPTDSPLAPVRSEVSFGQEGAASADGVAECSSSSEAADAGQVTVGQAVVEALAGGGLFFRQIADAVRRRLAPERVDEARIASALWSLVWEGRATNDTFAPVRALDAGGSAGAVRTAPRRRVSSRRGRHRGYDTAPARRDSMAVAMTDRAGAGGVPAGALSGRWSLMAPPDANDTVRAVALVESLLDRYGVLSRDIALLAGVPGGLGTLMPVLRSMEDAGDVLRGMFVEGMGPAQFAARETVDVLRSYAAQDAPAGGGQKERMVVLAADDPAGLFGAALPWPPVAGGHAEDAGEGAAGAGGAGDGRSVEDAMAAARSAEDAAVAVQAGEDAAIDRATDAAAATLRPTRRPGSLVVLCDGEPVLYATAALRSLLSFISDKQTLEAAARALAAHTARMLVRDGADGARKKIVVETFDGAPVLSTPFADVLQKAGFVRLPDGMRLYVDPFAR